MLTGLSVLIVDDNLHMLRILSAMVRGFGVRKLFAVQEPTDAFDILKNHQVDLVLADLRLPVIDGIEFTSLVRNSNDSPDPFVPIIMITAHSEREKVEAARDAGVTEFICKPLTANTLYQRITSVAESRRPFVRTANYFGPDRRRRNDPGYKGPERRQPKEPYSV